MRIPRRPHRLHRLPGTAPIFCADASDRSKPWPAAHREQDGYHLPCAAHTAAVPPSPHTLPASPVHSQPYTAPFVDDSARRLPITSAGRICRGDSATGWYSTDHTEVMRTPCFRLYPPSALGISEKRAWHRNNSWCDGPGRRQQNLCSPACAARIGERCEFGEGYCGNVREVPIRTHITYTSRFFVFPFSFTSTVFFTLV
jgi:hypothetical protein